MLSLKPAILLLISAAIGGTAAFAATGSAPTDADLPVTMPAPPARPAVGDLIAFVQKVPSPRPEQPDQAEADEDTGGDRASGELPAEEKACRTRLRAMGVEFEPLPEIDDEGQCGIAYPISVSSLGRGIELSPDAVMNCATTEAAAGLVRDTVKPAAKRELDAGLSGIRHASAYVCRMRASGKKISEHAKGNALDIAAFTLSDGRVIDVKAYGPADRPERRFMRAVRSDACGPFKTVLGPGTDADHATHFHLDLAERRRGSTYCR